MDASIEGAGARGRLDASGIVNSMNDSVARSPLAESAAAYLEPGEEIVVVEGSQAVDFWKGRRGIQDQPTPTGVRFVRHQMAVVITTRRFLMFKIGGFLLDRAQKLLT